MKQLNQIELFQIRGGFKLTSSFLTAIVRAADIFLEIGRSVGSAVRRYQTGKMC